ncbi:hypothetical protein IMZ48_07325 [Candidatus Bathyarchaeota archaeon]|nr:hypothetical protein [Candidatus Bathyarchaeota archaeon]
MKYLALAVLLAAPCVLAKSKAKVNTSNNPVKHLARSPVAAVEARQATTSEPVGELCGTDGSSPALPPLATCHPPASSRT